MERAEMSGVAYTDRLFELAERRVAVLQAMLDLQSDCGNDSDNQCDRILSMLARRQSLLDELLAIDKALDDYRHDDPEARQWRSPERRLQCKEFLSRAAQLLRRVIDHDEHTIAQLESSRATVALQLQEMNSSTDVRSAYLADTNLLGGSLDMTEP